MMSTPISPYIFGISWTIKYEVNNKKGTESELRGVTKESSPYLRALRRVIVETAFPREVSKMSHIFSICIVGSPI